MRTFIPWIGGKTQLVHKITAEFPQDFGRYIEVFGGGGRYCSPLINTQKSRFTTMLTATL